MSNVNGIYEILGKLAGKHLILHIQIKELMCAFIAGNNLCEASDASNLVSTTDLALSFQPQVWTSHFLLCVISPLSFPQDVCAIRPPCELCVCSSAPTTCIGVKKT